jgi:hypothetical protein
VETVQKVRQIFGQIGYCRDCVVIYLAIRSFQEFPGRTLIHGYSFLTLVTSERTYVEPPYDIHSAEVPLWWNVGNPTVLWELMEFYSIDRCVDTGNTLEYCGCSLFNDDDQSTCFEVFDRQLHQGGFQYRVFPCRHLRRDRLCHSSPNHGLCQTWRIPDPSRRAEPAVPPPSRGPGDNSGCDFSHVLHQ